MGEGRREAVRVPVTCGSIIHLLRSRQAGRHARTGHGSSGEVRDGRRPRTGSGDAVDTAAALDADELRERDSAWVGVEYSSPPGELQ